MRDEPEGASARAVTPRRPRRRRCAAASLLDAPWNQSVSVPPASGQGLTLVHFKAQLEHYLWDRGCVQRLFRGVFRWCQGIPRGG